MAERKPLFMGAEPYAEEMATGDTLTIGGLTMGGDVVMAGNKVTGLGDAAGAGDAVVFGQAGASLAGLTTTGDIAMGGNEVTGLPATPTVSNAAASKAYVDQQVISGGSVLEAVFSIDQLSNVEGILGLSTLYLANNPVSGDYVELTDGATTRRYQFGAGGNVTVPIGVDAWTSMQNLGLAINGDGLGAWGSEAHNDKHINVNPAGVVEIWELDNNLAASQIYGVFTTQADLQYVNFTGEVDYTKSVTVTMPIVAPGATNFGFRRDQLALTAGEIHYVLGYDILYSWDPDNTAWNVMSGSGSVPDATAASGGGIKGKLTGDSDKGVGINLGILEVTLATNLGLQFTGGGVGVLLDPAGGTLNVTATGIAVAGLPTLFTIGGIATNATVDSAALNVLTGGVASNADAEHTHSFSPTGHSHTHAAITGVGANDHHNELHTVASHSDTTTTGTELDELSGGGVTALHSHAASSHVHGHGDLSGISSDQHHAQVHGLDGVDHTVSGLTAGNVLRATAATSFGFGQVQHTDLGGLTADDHHNQAHDMTSVADHTETGLTIGNVLQATGATTFAWQQVDHTDLATVGANDHHNELHTVASHSDTTATGAELDELTGGGATALHTHAGANAAERVEGLKQVVEAVSVADPVYWSATSGQVGKAISSVDAKARVVGVAKTAQATPGLTAAIVSQGECLGVLTGATPGTPYYLQAAGGIGVGLPGAANRVIACGYAITATDLWVSIRDYGKKAA